MWQISTISDLGTVVGGSTPSKTKPEYYTNNGIAWITPKDLSINKSKFISHGENDITELGLKNSSATVMPKGTVLFSSRAPIGYIAIASNEVTTNQGFKSVIPYSEIGTAFVYFFLKHSLPVIESAASGSTFKEISGSAMKNIPAIIPDRNTLDQFNSFCAPIFAQQKILEEQNHSLAMLRDSLLPKLMSGAIDIASIQLYAAKLSFIALFTAIFLSIVDKTDAIFCCVSKSGKRTISLCTVFRLIPGTALADANFFHSSVFKK